MMAPDTASWATVDVWLARCIYPLIAPLNYKRPGTYWVLTDSHKKVFNVNRPSQHQRTIPRPVCGPRALVCQQITEACKRAIKTNANTPLQVRICNTEEQQTQATIILRSLCR